MTDTLGKYISSEEYVETSNESGDFTYTPLDGDEVAARLAARPDRDGAVDISLMTSRITKVWFTLLTPEHGQSGRAIACTVELDNGYLETGLAHVASLDNYDEELGKYFAYKDAVGKLMPIAAFLTMERSAQDQ